jgi:two-component system sensor histidine kinase KdpD
MTVSGETRPGAAVRPASISFVGTMNEYFLAAISVGLATAVALAIEPFTGYLSVALLYLLLVVAVGLRLRRGPVLAVAATSALLWNFLFIPPRLTFYIAKVEDGMMFAMFFIVAMAMGHLTSRLRRSEVAERSRERRTAALYELAHQAAFATDLDTGLRAAVGLIESVFGARAALLLRMKDHTLSQIPHPASSMNLSAAERNAAELAFTRQSSAGKIIAAPRWAEVLHLPLQGRTAVMGVLSVGLPSGKSLDEGEKELIEAFAVLIGLTLEKDHVIEAFKRAEILEASERLRRALLESVSHELKTPLAAVQTGVDALANQIRSDARARATIREMQLALRRQHRVINNLLDMTRIESGVVRPKLDWCDVGELVQAAIELAGENIAENPLTVEVDRNLPMVKVDQALLEQCLSNLLLNSAAYGRPGTKITVRARLSGNNLLLSVLDEGGGIRDADLPRIFETFYRGSETGPGGTGLGLAIVDGFVRAHGGAVAARNRATGGAEFAITIPVESLKPDILEGLA